MGYVYLYTIPYTTLFIIQLVHNCKESQTISQYHIYGIHVEKRIQFFNKNETYQCNSDHHNRSYKTGL